MWLWAVVSIALALPTYAFRLESGRLDLEAFEAEAASAVERAELLPEPVEEAAPDVDVEATVLTSESCKDGVLFFQGTMIMKEEFVFSKECGILRGANGSQVILEAPIEFKGDLRLEGNLRFKATRPFGWKACLRIDGNASVHGDLRIEDCENQGLGSEGGGLLVWKNLTQHGGTIEVTNCSSGVGGGLSVREELTQHAGTIEVKNCSSDGAGGGLLVWKNLTQHGGTIEVTNCSSGAGGGLYVLKDLTQHGGTIEVTNCSSEKDGGGLLVSNLTQHAGTLGFHGCSSGTAGGGVIVRDRFYQSGSAVFENCMAKDDGGGLSVKRLEQKAATANLSFSQCRAQRGGGIFAEKTIVAVQPMLFRSCRAFQSGGGIQIGGKDGSVLDNARFESCSAPRATAIEARTLSVKSVELVDSFQEAISAPSLNISNLTFVVNGLASGRKPGVSIESVNLRIDSELDCSKLQECRVLVPLTSPPKTGKLHCSRGAGVGSAPTFGCWACPEGFTQVEEITNESCLPCPKGAAACTNDNIQMETGLMVHETNVSRSLHCPAKAACRNGELPKNEDRPMCQKGYGDEGCAKCIVDEGTLYLTADSSVLACAPCANRTMDRILQWIAFLVQKSALFAISAASIFGAGRADRVKNSGVYINQLMAFAAVSSSVITTVLQTETARTMKNAAVKSLYDTAAFMSEAGSGQGVSSSHCLLSYVSLEDSGLWGVHCLETAVAALLVLLLSLKDFRVALVAGLNCFLPNILADFTKYAVCYKLEEDPKGDGLICNHLPFSNVIGSVLVSLGFLAVFGVGLWLWIRLSTSHAATKEDELPSHVAFLTNKYAEGRQYFEAERLVRKVLLTSAAAYYPSTTYPELQMTAQAVITSGSMFLYGVFHPYTQPDWNWNELRLSLTALLLIYLTSTVMANEEQWDKTERAQQLMIISLGVVVTAVCSGFIVKIALEVWRERRPQAQAPA